MHQVSILLRTGEVQVLEVPTPSVPDGGALVNVRASVVSAGTEQAKLEAGAQSLVAKARARPDAVNQVLGMVRREGLRAAADLVRTRLDAPQPLGYSCAGVVEAVGPLGGDLRPGQRVACAGGGYANHASVVSVPRNLMARVPDGVSDEAAAYSTVGAIALQGLRQADCRLGDRILVIGLGLIGQLVCQLASAAGCLVYGLDPDEEKTALAARASGTTAATSLEELRTPSGQAGTETFDAVVVTAATQSSQPLADAARAVRDRGRVVVVGDVGLTLNRTPFYEKEVELRFSRSYGPGRYDPNYEELGIDYPIGYVRWTVQRNMEAFLGACASGRIDPVLLTTHRFPIEAAPSAYQVLSDRTEFTVGVVLEYPSHPVAPVDLTRVPALRPARDGVLTVGVIGTGRFATRVLLPALHDEPKVSIDAVASERGLSTDQVAAKYGARPMSVEQVLQRKGLEAVVIATRHDTHAQLVVAALQAGLHVLVEKPLVRVEDELPKVLEAYGASNRVCIVGFNRRHAPATGVIRDHLGPLAGPTQVLIRINAGQLSDHWLVDPGIGGGRLIGEGCHFIDLAAHLIGTPAVGVVATGVPVGSLGPAAWQSMSVALDYPDGSTATILYSALGDPRMPKERVEVYKDGTSAVIDDFRRWELWRNGRKTVGGGRVADKGHRAELSVFAAACQAGNSHETFANDVASTVATFAAVRSLGSGRRVEVPQVEFHG